MLKITKATEPLNITTIVTCIYGLPYSGKTSLASSSEDSLLLDFDMGAQRSDFRGDVVRITDWNDVAQLAQSDLAPYKTIIVDTAGGCLKTLSLDIIRANSKMGFNGSLTMQGYGQLKGRFDAWVTYLRSFKMDIIFVAHTDEKEEGATTKERIIAPGSSRNLIYEQADLMGKLWFSNGSRTVSFDPTDTSFGKNPAKIPAQAVPDLAISPRFFAGIIARTKDSLNKMDAKNSEARELVEQWRVCFERCQTAEDFNILFPKAKETKNKTISAMMVAAAKKLGFKFDKAKGVFE
jgi:hypothetical protein